MHFTFVSVSGKVVKSWDAGLCQIVAGEKIVILRESGVNGDSLTESTVANTALGYFVDAAVNGCNPASKKEREYAPIVLKHFAKVPDSAVVIYGMPALDSAGRLTGDFVTILQTTMKDVRDSATRVIEWTPAGFVVATMPTPPAGLVPAKKRGKTSAILTPLEWDDEAEG